MTTTDLLRLSLSSQPKLSFTYLTTTANVHRSHFNALPKRRRFYVLRPPNLISAKAVEFRVPSPEFQQPRGGGGEEDLSSSCSVLLDVTGMMCGACVSRVKSILSADDRVDSAVVNMLTETAAIKLNTEGGIDEDNVAEEFARKLTECGFPAKRRVSGLGVEEKVEKWKESVAKKEALLVESRNRVIFAWTLVALCCGSHATHVLHSLGIHVGHGTALFHFELNLN